MNEARDEGEPWAGKTDLVTGDNIIVDRHGNEIACIYEWSVWKRIQAESRALAGCPDPEAFVAAAKALIVKSLEMDEQLFGEFGGEKYVEDKAISDPALAWLRKKNK